MPDAVVMKKRQAPRLETWRLFFAGSLALPYTVPVCTRYDVIPGTIYTSDVSYATFFLRSIFVASTVWPLTGIGSSLHCVRYATPDRATLQYTAEQSSRSYII